MISNVNSLAIVTSSMCESLPIVTSHWSIVLTLYLWTLSSSQWRCQPGRFSMAAHRHDRREIYRCVLLRFRGRIEIDHSYGLRCRGLCCHSRHSTRGAGRRGRKRPRDGRLHSCCAGSGSTNHTSADRIVLNSYNPFHCDIGMAWITSLKSYFLRSPICGTPWCLQGRVMFKMSKYLYRKLYVTAENSCT